MIFDFDDKFRKIDFAPGVETEANAVLNASGSAIAELDAIGQADDPAEVIRLAKRFQREKVKLIEAADALARKL